MSVQLLSGWLTKRGDIRKNWKRRFFVLQEDGHLKYYGSELDVACVSAKNIIDLSDWPDTCKTGCRFALVTSKRVFYFFSDTPEEAKDWISELNRIAHNVTRLSPAKPAKEAVKDTSLEGKITTTPAEAAKVSEPAPAIPPLQETGDSGSAPSTAPGTSGVAAEQSDVAIDDVHEVEDELSAAGRFRSSDGHTYDESDAEELERGLPGAAGEAVAAAEEPSVEEVLARRHREDARLLSEQLHRELAAQEREQALEAAKAEEAARLRAEEDASRAVERRRLTDLSRTRMQELKNNLGSSLVRRSRSEHDTPTVHGDGFARTASHGLDECPEVVDTAAAGVAGTAGDEQYGFEPAAPQDAAQETLGVGDGAAAGRDRTTSEMKMFAAERAAAAAERAAERAALEIAAAERAAAEKAAEVERAAAERAAAEAAAADARAAAERAAAETAAAERIAAESLAAEGHAESPTSLGTAEAVPDAEAERAAAEKAAALRAEAEAEAERAARAAAKAEADRIATEKAEAARAAAEKAEAERIAAAEAAARKAEADRAAAEKAEADRMAAEKAEADRIAAEKAEAEKAAAVKAEAEKAAAVKAEAERIARAEAERIAAAEAARIAAEKAEAERAAAMKAEAERIARAEAERAAAERIAAEKAEAERIAAEKAEAERIAAEKAEAERIAAEKATAVQAAATPSEPPADVDVADNDVFGDVVLANTFGTDSAPLAPPPPAPMPVSAGAAVASPPAASDLVSMRQGLRPGARPVSVGPAAPAARTAPVDKRSSWTNIVDELAVAVKSRTRPEEVVVTSPTKADMRAAGLLPAAAPKTAAPHASGPAYVGPSIAEQAAVMGARRKASSTSSESTSIAAASVPSNPVVTASVPSTPVATSTVPLTARVVSLASAVFDSTPAFPDASAAAPASRIEGTETPLPPEAAEGGKPVADEGPRTEEGLDVVHDILRDAALDSELSSDDETESPEPAAELPVVTEPVVVTVTEPSVAAAEPAAASVPVATAATAATTPTPAPAGPAAAVPAAPSGSAVVAGTVKPVSVSASAVSAALASAVASLKPASARTHTHTPHAPAVEAALDRRISVSVQQGQVLKQRALAAVQWVDKESYCQLRKLIEAIQEFGSKDTTRGIMCITFGILFVNTANRFERADSQALSGTLNTARKKGVVAYDAELLMQGRDDAVPVFLMRDTIPDSDETTYTYRELRACSISNKRGKGFGKTSLQNAGSKCVVCSKTVYPMEFVGANDKAFHKACFRCSVCRGPLRSDNMATLNDKYYCQAHYEQAFKSAGCSYSGSAFA